MDFRTWWYRIPADQRAAVASRLQVSEGYLNCVAGGFRQPGESLCMRIEHESDRVIRCESLRPDVPWHLVRVVEPRRQAVTV